MLVADSQRLVGEALGIALDTRPHLDVVAEYPTTGPGVLRSVHLSRPDVVVLDFWLTGMNGPATTKALGLQAPGTKVLLLSWITGPHQVQAALEAGAVGFLPKSLTFSQLNEAIGRAFEGEALVFADELAAMVSRIDARYAEATAQEERLLTLSARELEILQFLSEGWNALKIGEELGIRVGTVKNHIHHILTKSGARSQLEVVAIARHTGTLRGGSRFPGSGS
ncbi:MAG: response regulator [Acidimicrobiales bacterium]